MGAIVHSVARTTDTYPTIRAYNLNKHMHANYSTLATYCQLLSLMTSAPN